MPGIRIELLGHFRMTSGGRPVTAIHSRQQALLACVILNRHSPMSRQQVASRLWPDSTDGQALTNLRREMYTLRQALPDVTRYLTLDAGTLQWRDTESSSIDAWEFHTAATSDTFDDLLRAAQLYAGDLLPDCFDEWIVSQREHLRAKYLDVLRRVTSLLEARRAYAEAIEYARKLMNAEPLEEDAYMTLMRLLALRGDTAGALRIYHTCASILARELSVEPNPAVQAAYRRLLEARTEIPRQLSSVATPPLVGRHAEWSRLMDAWRAAVEGPAQMVLIRGEAGIGKTRLAEALAEWCAGQGIAASRVRAYAMEGRLAYAPVADWLRSESLRPILAHLDRPWLSEVARLLPDLAAEHRDLPPPEPLREGWQRQRLFEALANVVSHGPSPLLLVLDDLQWTDRDTLEWLHYMLRGHAGHVRLLIAGTLRTEEAADNAALSDLLSSLRQLQRLIEIDVGPLNEVDTAALAAHVTGQRLHAQTAGRLFKQTEGHPLFIVEIARAGRDGSSTLPPKVQAVIAARLSRLTAAAQDLVRVAAVTGRDFTFDILREASDLDEKALVEALDELWQRRIVREHGAHGYDFSHDRVREVAYLEISPATRRLLHRRVAQALELLHASNMDPVSARVAAHYEQAGQSVKAVDFYRRAADVAARVFAVEEVIHHLSRALTLLRQLPESLERDKEELAMRLDQSAALGAARGYPSPELESALIRLKSLGETLGETVAIAHAIVGLSGVHLLRGNDDQSVAFAQEALQLTDRLSEDHDTLRAGCHFVAGTVPYVRADLATARHHFDLCAAFCRSPGAHLMIFGPDALMFAHAFNTHIQWLAGYADQAARTSRASIARAEEIGHPMSQAIAHAYAALTQQLLGDVAASLAHARAATDLCMRYGVAYYGDWGTIFGGWSLARTQRVDEGIAMIREGIENMRKLNTPRRRGYYLSLLGDLLLRADRIDEARAVIDAALTVVAQTGEVWWNAELYRLRGALSDAPEHWYIQGLEIARSQGARSLELRAATSLARLWMLRREAERAYDLLAPVYGWFTEGFETPDLLEARALLDDLRASPSGI